MFVVVSHSLSHLQPTGNGAWDGFAVTQLQSSLLSQPLPYPGKREVDVC